MTDVHALPQEPTQEQLDRAIAASRAASRGRRTKILGTILIAGIGVGASVMSCVGQSFTLRQARAQEDIVQQLLLLRAQLQQGCQTGTP